MAAEREDHVDLGADAFDQAADLGKIGGHVVGAIDRADDVDARLGPSGRLRGAGTRPPFGPNSVHSHFIARSALCHWSSSMVRGRNRVMLEPSGVTPPPIISAIDPVTDDRRQIGIERQPGPAHRAFGAVLSQLVFRQAADDDGQFMRRQRIGVMQHRGDGQVLAAHRTVNDDLQALDRGELRRRMPNSRRPCRDRVSASDALSVVDAFCDLRILAAYLAR